MGINYFKVFFIETYYLVLIFSLIFITVSTNKKDGQFKENEKGRSAPVPASSDRAKSNKSCAAHTDARKETEANERKETC
jgi:hypothetical protein